MNNSECKAHSVEHIPKKQRNSAFEGDYGFRRTYILPLFNLIWGITNCNMQCDSRIRRHNPKVFLHGDCHVDCKEEHSWETPNHMQWESFWLWRLERSCKVGEGQIVRKWVRLLQVVWNLFVVILVFVKINWSIYRDWNLFLLLIGYKTIIVFSRQGSHNPTSLSDQ